MDTSVKIKCGICGTKNTKVFELPAVDTITVANLEKDFSKVPLYDIEARKKFILNIINDRDAQILSCIQRS